jgi:hypothetical protein
MCPSATVRLTTDRCADACRIAPAQPPIADVAAPARDTASVSALPEAVALAPDHETRPPLAPGVAAPVPIPLTSSHTILHI